MARLLLDNIGQLLLLMLEALCLLKTIQYSISQCAARLPAEPPLFWQRVVYLRYCGLMRFPGRAVIQGFPLHLEPLVNHSKDHAVHHCLTEFLYEVQDERRLTRSVNVQESREWLQSSQSQSAPHL